MFKNFCPVCWVCFTVLTGAWLMGVVVLVLSLIAGLTGVAIAVGVAVAVCGTLIAWVGYSEANDHWKEKR
jgi:hypothetical protein